MVGAREGNVSAAKHPRCPGGCNVGKRYGGIPDADYPSAADPRVCEMFFCAGCHKDRPWCQGAADATPLLCDDCVAARAA